MKAILRMALMMFVIVLVSGCARDPKGYRMLIPENFSGTAYMYYNIPDAKQLIEDGYLLVVFSEQGIARIPSGPVGGKPYSEYWLYSGNKRTRMSPYKLGGGATIKQTNSLGQRETFFQFEVLKEERPHDTFWSILTTW